MTLTVFASGGLSVPWAGIVSAVITEGMSAAQKREALTAIGGMSLVDAYDSAIEDKIEAIRVFDGHVAVYNMSYTAYFQIYEAHATWDTHEGAGSGSNGTHTKKDWTSDWKLDRSLPSYRCGGRCGNSFNTPKSEHWVKCGNGENVDAEARRRYGESNKFFGPHDHIVLILLSERSVHEGCGRHYYNCISLEKQEHKFRYCNKQVYSESTSQICGQGYRNCMGLSTEHGSGSTKTGHDENAGVSSSEENSITSAPDSSTPTTPSTPSYHTCGTHETTVSGNHESAGCGTSGHYACDDDNHSMQASCTGTDSNGNDCDVINFYMCDGHTHQAVDNTPNCSNCTDGCSSCQATCTSGHTFDPTVAYDVNQQRTRTCRYDTCGQTWQKCVSSAPTCNDPDRNRQGRSCWAID